MEKMLTKREIKKIKKERNKKLSPRLDILLESFSKEEIIFLLEKKQNNPIIFRD